MVVFFTVLSGLVIFDLVSLVKFFLLPDATAADPESHHIKYPPKAFNLLQFIFSVFVCYL